MGDQSGGIEFEHGGVAGSANHRGPILLASHAGMFVRMYRLTKDSLFLNMARAAAMEDAFVDFKRESLPHWDSMNNGAGPIHIMLGRWDGLTPQLFA